ncbi:MAG: patatin-like phospholipase family protein [Peptostreptococcaceae bacterium]
MYADLVCKGGGVKGVALIGAISYFEEHGYTWRRLAGTSAGAVVASLLAVGYTSTEIQQFIFNLDFNSLLDKNKLQSIPLIGPIAGLFFHKGIYCGDTLENLLRSKFKAKGKTTFKDISIDGDSILKIMATDITNQTLITLPDDLIKYNINPLDFDIAKAVRMSLSIPFLYKPIILNEKVNPSYIVDGGLLSNFPVWIFDTSDEPKWPTFGLNLIDYKSQNNFSKSFSSFIFDVIETSLNTNENTYFKESDSIRIVNIPTLGVNILDMDISPSKMSDLFNSGYNCAKQFLNNWDFEDYTKKYR